MNDYVEMIHTLTMEKETTEVFPISSVDPQRDNDALNAQVLLLTETNKDLETRLSSLQQDFASSQSQLRSLNAEKASFQDGQVCSYFPSHLAPNQRDSGVVSSGAEAAPAGRRGLSFRERARDLPFSFPQ